MALFYKIILANYRCLFFHVNNVTYASKQYRRYKKCGVYTTQLIITA